MVGKFDYFDSTSPCETVSQGARLSNSSTGKNKYIIPVERKDCLYVKVCQVIKLTSVVAGFCEPPVGD